jgi:hypothetical protein
MNDCQEWISVREYAKRKKLKTPQVVYNWIAKNKLKENLEWRKMKIEKSLIQVLWKE